MRLQESLIMLMLVFTCLLAHSQASPLVKELVPGGKILTKSKELITVETPKKTIIELVFDEQGKLEEASGKAILTGDVFVPGEKLLSLDKIAEKLKDKKLDGEWTFEATASGDWTYDVEGTEKSKKVDYIMNAETGAITSIEIDE
jgi:uncharacterized membrane protein YkoI